MSEFSNDGIDYDYHAPLPTVAVATAKEAEPFVFEFRHGETMQVAAERVHREAVEATRAAYEPNEVYDPAVKAAFDAEMMYGTLGAYDGMKAAINAYLRHKDAARLAEPASAAPKEPESESNNG